MNLNDTSYPARPNDTVVVKLWEIYLLYHPANLYKILTASSLDNGPVDQSLNGRVVFRFEQEVWHNHIKGLLYEFRIPVVVQSNPLEAVLVKGRQPVLR